MGRLAAVLGIVSATGVAGLRTQIRFRVKPKREFSRYGRLAERPAPQVIQVDNGTEFSCSHFDAWAYARGIRIDYIRPGKHSMTKDDWKVYLDFAVAQWR